MKRMVQGQMNPARLSRNQTIYEEDSAAGSRNQNGIE
jgi:hypothetical protein